MRPWGARGPDGRACPGDERFRQAVMASAVGVVLIRPDSCIVDVNEAFCAMVGRVPDQLVGSPWSVITPTAMPPAHRALLAEVLAGQRDTVHVVSRVTRADGSIIHVDVSGSALRGEDGAVETILAHVVDISDLVDLRERYRLLAENVTDVVAVGDNDGVLEWISSSVTTVMGHSPSAMVGRQFRSFVHPDDRAHVSHVQAEVSAGRMASMDVRMSTADGGHRWMSIRVRPVLDDAGAVVGRVAAWWDAQDEHDTNDLLARNEARLRGALEAELDEHVLMEAVRDGAGAIVDLVIVEANSRALHYLGMRRDQVLGRSALGLFPDHAGSVLFRRAIAVVETGVPLVLDALALSNGGQGPRSFDFRAVRVGDGLSLLWRDVTVRAAQARERIEAERYYRILVENSTDIVAQVSAYGDLEWVSPAVTEVLGHEPEELVGRRVANMVHPSDVQAAVSAMAAAAAGTGVRFRSRFRMVAGGWRWLEVGGRALTDTSGRVVGSVLSLRDAHDQVEAEEALVRAEARLRMLADNVVDVIVETDPEGRLTWVSGSSRDVMGLPPESLVGRTVEDILHPDDHAALVTAILRSAAGERFLLRGRFAVASGWRWFEVSGRPVRGSSGEVLARVGVLRECPDPGRSADQVEAGTSAR